MPSHALSRMWIDLLIWVHRPSCEETHSMTDKCFAISAARVDPITEWNEEWIVASSSSFITSFNVPNFHILYNEPWCAMQLSDEMSWDESDGYNIVSSERNGRRTSKSAALQTLSSKQKRKSIKPRRKYDRFCLEHDKMKKKLASNLLNLITFILIRDQLKVSILLSYNENAIICGN